MRHAADVVAQQDVDARNLETLEALGVRAHDRVVAVVEHRRERPRREISLAARRLHPAGRWARGGGRPWWKSPAAVARRATRCRAATRSGRSRRTARCRSSVRRRRTTRAPRRRHLRRRSSRYRLPMAAPPKPSVAHFESGAFRARGARSRHADSRHRRRRARLPREQEHDREADCRHEVGDVDRALTRDQAHDAP